MKKNNLKNNLRNFRQQRNLTIEQMANDLRISNKEIKRIEENNANPSILLAMKIANYLNTEVEEIFILDE